ncbi:late competence protein ComER [Paenibacillus alvei]|uniref:Pyrroline-5-carboxylate reductase n=1 Tax=Paenibacillus alvei TaxID=44250 RepID=A0ABT4GU61_PAEAL|nr:MULTISPECIES: late competence protein ComER [Paenibacillus]EJW17301.1 ComE operon protein 4 [Paenibacillus alvei DSM 29]MCY7487528.1 late competence protein ComER [Paenibacillus alvei]MCY9542907.1 late competence protein ComER [Paenibacillus alvei]MCY9706915.1 late competence protein ComER [Paenibacillus alvei]MCY9735160.1 late competence protein ComER [Paenibacillus alvei]
MKVGFIGTGSMGSTIIEALLQSGALESSQLIASNRSKHKIQQLAAQYPGFQLASSNVETVQESDIVFICVKPLEFKTVLDEIAPFVRPELIAVSITSPVLISHLEQQLTCKIAKIIPSITNYVWSGASLCMYGSRILTEDRLLLEQLMMSISRPVQVPEQFTRITSDISSCGPAFIAFFVQKWVDAAVEVTGIERKDAERLASEMLLGTGKLLTEGGFTLEHLKQRVAVPGGITAEALRLLDDELEGVFQQLIQVTHAKYEEDLHKVEFQLFGEELNRPQC